jgi:hypothetical protein
VRWGYYNRYQGNPEHHEGIFWNLT